MNITINTNLIPTLERLATGRNITPQEHLEDYINSYLLSQYKQHIIAKISDEKVDNLTQLDEVIVAKKLAIKEAYDLANPKNGEVSEVPVVG